MWDFTTLGLILVFLGVAVVLIAVLTKSGGSQIRGAGVVMVGPIPLVFGSDARWASIAMALAIALVAVSLLFYLYLH